MTSLTEFGIPILVVFGYYLLLWALLRAFGLRFFLWWSTTPEKVAPYRRLRRWQFIVVEGLLSFPVPMLVYLVASGYIERHYDQHYLPHHHYVGTAITLAILICAGILSGLDQWKKIWD